MSFCFRSEEEDELEIEPDNAVKESFKATLNSTTLRHFYASVFTGVRY